MSNFRTITTQDMYVLLSEDNIHIIDVRDVNAYNGWKLNNERRGGHIMGARSLPSKWLNYMDWIEIVRSKEILENQKLIIYGYTREDSLKVASAFEKYGYQDICIYAGFVSEWCENDNLPMDYLPRYRNLVPATLVKEIIDGNIPKELEGRKIVIVHSHYRNRNAYLTGHIPGAIDMDTLALESPETWNRRSPQELKNALEQHGISADTTVIVYGKFMWPDNDDPFPGSAAGHLGAIRSNAIMLYAGVKDVRVINGGFQSWIDEGYEISHEDVIKTPIDDFGGEIPLRPEIFVDTDEAKKMIASSDADIVSVRSWDEYIGKVSGYNYIEKKGSIPGSIFGNCGSDAYHMENYRNLDHTIREANEVEDIWYEVGVTPDKHLAFYCGTGWRGSEAFYSAYLMGWRKVSVYDGGWFEWSNNPKNPIQNMVATEKF